MSAAIRFKRVLVQNVGVLGERAIALDELSPGINVISGPNECGKSSVVRALRAALFQRHGTGHSSVRALQPYNSKLSPYVEVEFEVDGVEYLLEKRFLKKGMARVRARDGSVDLHGDDADTWLFARLDAREPAKKGVNPDDMGVWGLLWVNQDAFATQEPSEAMGDHVRGSLSRTIGSLVGNVMGGEYGVALKRAIEEEHDKYWTAKQQGATEKLLAERRRVEALAETVKQLHDKETETVRLADQLREREQDLEALEAEAAEIAQLLRACEDAVRVGDALERSRDEAADALRAGEESLKHAAKQHADRAARRAELAEAEQLARTRDEVVERLRAEHQRHQSAWQAASEAAASIRRDVDALRDAVEGHRRALERVRAREDLRQLEGRLAEARRLDGAIREAREALRALPDADALRALAGLEARRAQHGDHVARHATQLRVTRPGAETEQTPVPTRRAVSLAALGALTIDPPREGFLKARDAWRATRTRLLARLEALRVESVAGARSLAEEHRRLSAEIGARRAKLDGLAPQGFAVLARECERHERSASELEATRDEAARLRDRLAGIDAELVASPLGEGSFDELVALDAKVQSMLALEASAAVRVSVCPLAAVRVQLGAREPTRFLTPGNDVRRPVAAPMTLVIDDKIQIEIDPGGAATLTAEALDAAQRALAAKLAAFSVATVDEARALSRARAALVADRAHAEQALHALAPHGVDALSEKLARVERTADDMRRKRDEASALGAEVAELEARLASISVRPEAFAELDALDRQCLAEEQAVRRLAGRVVAAEGAVAPALEGREELVEPLDLTIQGVRVEVAPGEVPHDVELPVLERELATKLKSFAVANLDEARRAHHEWLTLSTRLESDRQSLAQLAPDGIAVLDADAARTRARVGPSDDVEEPRASLEVALDVAQRRLEARRLELITAEALAESLRGEAERARDAFAQADRARIEQQVRRNTLAEQLRVEEAVASDGALREAGEGARAEVERLRARHEEAARACDAALPEVRRADRDRERASLADVTRRVQALRESHAHEKGTLDGRLGEGYFDKRAEAEAALAAAQADLARVEREAKAVRLLRETASKAYDEAQQTLMGPVYREAMPLLQIIRPGTSFRMNRDTLQLEQVLRHGVEEEFGHLSGGAREQLAVVVRIALAKVFAQQQRALPLILDDILGWTDDRRLRAMLNVLERTAQDLQVILLTCHPGRFRGLSGARTIALDELKAAP